MHAVVLQNANAKIPFCVSEVYFGKASGKQMEYLDSTSPHLSAKNSLKCNAFVSTILYIQTRGRYIYIWKQFSMPPEYSRRN